jgi:hypothetical protein
METVIGAIVKAVLSYFKLWYDGERREAAEWEAKAMAAKMESMKMIDRIEREVNAAIPDAVISTAAAWNEKARLRGAGLLLLLCLVLPGCLFTKYVTIEGEWLTIDVPVCPTLPAEPKDFTPRETILATYANTLDTRVLKYNTAARAHNIQYGYTSEGDSNGR